MNYVQHDYQKAITKFIVDKPRVAIFAEMGLGKTSSTLKAIDDLIYDKLEVNKVLIVAPLKVARLTWKEEIDKWEEFHHLRISKVVGDEKHRLKALEQDADIYITNVSNFVWLVEHYRALGKWPFQMFIVDESTLFKNKKSKKTSRYKSAEVAAKITKRVVELSGTPMPNSITDVWGQIYLLDQGASLGRTLHEFRCRYMVPLKYFGQNQMLWGPREGALEMIERSIKDIAFSFLTLEHIKMPERVDNVIKIDMPESIKKVYKKLEHDYLITIDEKLITASTAAVVSNKLLQMANGASYITDEEHPESKEYVRIHDLKLEALEDVMEQNEDKPIMVLYQFKHDEARLLEYFARYKPRVLSKDQDKEDWDKGKIRMLLAHPASMAHGLNLQAGGNIIVWFGLTWNLEHYLQANARLYRQGQKETVVINHLVVAGTMDERVIEALGHKEEMQSHLMRAVRAAIKEAKEEKI